MLSVIIGDIEWQEMFLSSWKPYIDIQEVTHLILMPGFLALVIGASLQCAVCE